ncbi:MAG: cell division protein FtsL [Chloroflexota bacterium]|nr:cell division protein FtsL [Chloroflexota bacterium]
MNVQGTDFIALGDAGSSGKSAGFTGLWARIRSAGTLPRPGVVVLTLVAAAFLVTMILVLQLQLQAARIATVNELERELSQLQRVRSALLVESATASNLPRIEQRAGELGMHPAEPAATISPPTRSRSRVGPSPTWSDPAPPEIPHWRDRFWHALLRWTGRSPSGA